MTRYVQQLHLAIMHSAGIGDRNPPERLLRRIAELEDPLTAAFDYETAQGLFGAIHAEFDYLSRTRHGIGEMNDSEFSKFVGLIRWLRGELQGIESLELSQGNLLACLVMASFIDEKRILWQELVLQSKKCSGLFATLKHLIQNSRCVFSTHGVSAPIWELDVVKRFEKADERETFVELEPCLVPLERALHPHFLIVQAVLCLAYNNFACLVTACSDITQTIAAMWIVDSLPNRLRFRLSIESENNRVRFSTLYRSMHHRQRKHKRYSRSNHKLLVSLLAHISKSYEVWEQFMRVFNKYPVRYPALQPALGEALANTSGPACDAYVDAISISGTSGREEVTECLRSFRRFASGDRRRAMLKRCFQRWNTFIEQESDENATRFDLVLSELDYGAAAFLSEYMERTKIEAKIREIETELLALHLVWFESETEMISKYYTLLSQLQLFAHARRITELGGDFSLTKGYLPQSVVSNWYFKWIDPHGRYVCV